MTKKKVDSLGLPDDLHRQVEEISQEKVDKLSENLDILLSPEEQRKLLQELQVHQIELTMQNESLRRTQEELESSKLRYFNLYDLAPVGYLALSEEGLIREANLTAANLLGVARSALLKKLLTHIIHHLDQDIYYLHRKQLFETGTPQVCELRLVKKDGSLFWARLMATLAQDRESGDTLCYAVMSDITARKHAEETIQESENRFKELFNHMSSGVAIYGARDNGKDFTIKDFNQSAEKIEKVKKDDIIGKSVLKVFPGVKDFGLFKVFQEVYQTVKPQYFPISLYKDQRISGWKENYVYKLPSGEIAAVYDDVTERKQAEDALWESERRFRDVTENALEWVWETNTTGKYTYASPVCKKILGYKPEELLGKHFYDLFVPEEREQLKKKAFEAFANKQPFREFINCNICKNGKLVWISTSAIPILDKKGNLLGYRGADSDITERKQSEVALNESEIKFRSIFDNASDGILLADLEKHQFYSANETICQMLGYTMEEIVNLNTTEIHPKEYLPYVMEQFEKQTRKEIKLAKDIPVKRKDGSIFYADINSKPIILSGKTYLLGIFRDITERRQSEERLKKTINATIETMSKIVEAKDPYTAGHQQRVCQLAVRIAKEMKLPEAKVEGIRIASLIHDIGKIGLPTEILSKPATLTNIELSLIKGHSQIGYDILQSIDFSYPIANIILQHHERMNGSGYPNHLKGDEILREACIIALADIIEAMSSHRPYRPAPGIDKALEEISQNKGILYDPEVVDTCLKLFKERGFKFE